MSDLAPVFHELQKIMRPYAAKLVTKTDSDKKLYLDTSRIQKNKQPLFFGAVVIMKNYVSYHLMPVYMHPKLLEGMSPGLKKRMQGKACFNFKTVDPPLFQELAALTKASFDAWEKCGYI